MPRKISKTKPTVKNSDQMISNKIKKEKPKTVIKPRVVVKKTAITPPSFQSTTTFSTNSTALQPNKKKRKKYPLIGLALMALLITVICLLFIIYQNKSEWEKFAGKISQQKVSKAVDSLILPEIISDEVIAFGKYQLSKNSWSPNGNKFFVLNTKNDLEKEYLIVDLKNTTSTTLELNNKNPKSLEWLDENFLLFGETVISFSEDKNLEKPEPKKDDPDNFPDFNQILKEQSPNQSPVLFKVSPNGEYLAYISGENLWLMQKNSNNSAADLGKVRVNPSSDFLPEIEWSKNSQFIIINENEIFDAVNKKVILPYLENQSDNRRASISPDQTKISVIEKIGDQPTKIYLINIDGYKKINVFSDPDLDSAIDLFNATFSANGQYLAFTFKKQLWLSETKTGKAKILKVANNNFQDIVFSPDDLAIAFTLESGELGIIKLNWFK